MLTMKIYLNESGSIASLDKDFPIIQGQVNNILLNIFVPTSLLAPNFKTIEDDEDTGELTSGTAVKIACKSLEQNGTYKLSQNYYLRFVKKLVKDNIEYALFERKLPKEFAFYFGNNTMIINAENIQFANITKYKATNTGNFTVTATQPPRFLAVTKTYEFYFGVGDKWYLDGYVVDLAREYGITVNGTPIMGNTITLLVEANVNTQINVITSQQVTYNVLQSNNLDKDTEIPASEIDTIEAYLNSLSAVLSQKQNKEDLLLDTTNKTVVGAINEVNKKTNSNATEISQNEVKINKLNNEVARLNSLVSTGERYIGTYTFLSTNGELPTNEQLLTFVRSIKGETYTLQNGDSVIVIVVQANTADRRYKFIYNETEQAWDNYEILPIELAENGVAGIVYGTYGVAGKNANNNYDMLVDIINGEIRHIWILGDNNTYIDLRETVWGNKQDIAKIINGTTTVDKALKDALGNNIAQTYLTKQDGATKQYVRDYALPRQFNDAVFLQEKDGEIVFDRDYPVDSTLITNTCPIGYTDLFIVSQTIKDYTFELSSKNGQTMYLALKSNSPNTFVSIHVITSYAPKDSEDFRVIGEGYTSAMLNTDVSIITVNTSYKDIEAVITVNEGYKIQQRVRILNSNGTVDITAYSSAVIPTYFTLNTNMQALTTAKVVQGTGHSTFAVMSQRATTEFGTPSSLTLSDENETRVTYSQENGITVVSVAEDIRENDDVLQYPTEFNVPIVVDGDLSMDVDENGKKVVISGANKVMITLVSSQQTNGTLTEEELALLQAKDSNYIEINDGEGHIEKYYFNTDATSAGFRVYTHIEDEPNLIIKSLTITLSVRSWVIQRYNINELLGGKVDKVTTAYKIYGTDENGNQIVYRLTSSASGGKQIPVYDGAHGKAVLRTNTPIEDLDCTNKLYVDDGLSGKLDKVDPTTLSGKYSAYVVNPYDANIKTLAIENGVSCREDNIVTYLRAIRGADKPNGGGVLLTNTPTLPYQCANKQYVDAQKVRKHIVSFENENGDIAGNTQFEILSTKPAALTWEDVYQWLSGFSVDLKSIFFQDAITFIVSSIENGNVVSTYYSRIDYPLIYDTVVEIQGEIL